MQRAPVLDARSIRPESLVVGERGLAEHAGAEAGPLARVLNADHHLTAVAGPERSVRCDRRVIGPAPGRRRSAVPRIVRRGLHPFAQRVEQRHVHGCPAAGRRAGEERGQDAGVRVHAGGDIRDGNASLGGMFFGPGDGKQSDLALNQQVVRLLVRIGARRSITGKRADNQLRITRPEMAGTRPETIRRARGKILDEDVRAIEQPRQDLRAFRSFEIQRQRFLRAIQPDEIARHPSDGRVVAASEVAAIGPLDFDDAGAQVGKVTRRQWRRDSLLERDDGGVGKGTIHQYDRGNPSTCSATYARIRFVEIGATWYSRVSRNFRSTS